MSLVARCLLALVCLAAAGGAWAQKRVALLIGNSAYAVAPLVNPANDAADLATALKARGFETVVALNTTKRDINSRVRAFADQITPGTVALFYYAGHGMQVRGRNYILPVDAKVQNEGDVVEQGVEIDAVLQRLEGKGAAINLVILDACRNNPFTSAKGSGLAAVDAPKGSLVAFATSPGKVALDGKGRNGVYTKHLLANLNAPGMRVEDVFKRVRVGVTEESQGQQVPWENTSLTTDFYFIPPSGDTATAGAPDADQQRLQMAIATRNKAELRKYLELSPTGRMRTQVAAAYESVIAAEPTRSAVEPSYVRDCPDCPRMVVLGKGSKAIGAFPVTVADYEQCVRAKACEKRDVGGSGLDNHPAINVSWHDAVKYTQWLSQRTKEKYRLPTEAEWAEAVEAGRYVGEGSTRQLVPYVECRSGNGYDRSAALVAGFPWRESACNDGFPQTSPVGVFLPNAIGMYDWAGNVWQWTSTCADPKKSPCEKYVLKGGSWASPLTALTPQAVLSAEPTLQGSTMGFRVWRE
ncbi:SUMF1/EgtB/PvdO family nonheme iron enzyme [Rhizobacter sp. J219]|uniref:caspase family protein n=1 Tax=Rhizobacter sp. J219 TaxID=2898430 RepID=UPI002150A540|nr:caspase family protein [Rhizobacter sp. J219]MCR5882474.1 SUMF1/EgtB/PvdO family nonheme iron enzyme [Rhizobacter sp. J219]